MATLSLEDDLLPNESLESEKPMDDSFQLFSSHPTLLTSTPIKADSPPSTPEESIPDSPSGAGDYSILHSDISTSPSSANHSSQNHSSYQEENPNGLEQASDLVQKPHQTCKDPTAQKQPNPKWYGFKIVGDNLDTTIKPRQQRLEDKTKSLHYFNSMAIKDRVDLSDYSDTISQMDADRARKLQSLLPSDDDVVDLKKNLAVIASRIITTHLPSFASLKGVVPTHIRHQHSDEMARKSEVVSEIR